MSDNENEDGLAYRSPIRSVVAFFFFALLIWGIWAEGMVGNVTALILLVVAAVLSWWLIKTRPENDEMTARDFQRTREPLSFRGD